MEFDEIDKLMRGKNINFLIGAGASVPLYPSLSFGENYPTFEEVVSNNNISEQAKIFMYIYYFVRWIMQMGKTREQFYESDFQSEVYKNYLKLVKYFYGYLQCEGNESPKRINIFTTNYDLLFERVFDDFLLENPLIYFNDGSRGVFKKYISNKNYYLNVTHSGYNDNYKREVPTVNLFKMHGSLSWKLVSDKIIVCEENDIISNLGRVVEDLDLNIKKIEKIIKSSKDKNIDVFIDRLNKIVKKLKLDKSSIKQFYEKYCEIAIINPNKYKFFKTVSEQHYYQLIRSFSYELERKQAILFVFGFSFADEHIRDIFERSLLNPELQVIMISYSKKRQDELKDLFKNYKNIKFFPMNFDNDTKGDFNFLLNLLGDHNE